MFTCIISSLSWTTVPNTHWSGPACWYVGIICSLLAVVLGNEQSMVVPKACQSCQAHPEKISKIRQMALVGGLQKSRTVKQKERSQRGNRGVSRWIERAQHGDVDRVQREEKGDEDAGKGDEEAKGGSEGEEHHKHWYHSLPYSHHHQELQINKRHERPSHLVLFALQAPIMCLTYSIVFFLAGLASVVLSPLAQNPGWNPEAKVSVRRIAHLIPL